MSFEALFGDTQSLLVQFGLLRHVPYLGEYHRPENQQGDRRRDGLLPEDAYSRFYLGPVCYGLYPYVQGGLQAYDGLEDASPADTDLHSSRGDRRFGHLVVLLLEVTHHVLSDGSEVLNNVGNGVRRIESPHQVAPLRVGGLCRGSVLCRYLLRGLLLEPPLLRYHGSGLQTLDLQGVEHRQLAQRPCGEGLVLRRKR